MNINSVKLPVAVFLFVFVILTAVQLILNSPPLLLLERFVDGGGWIEIIIISFYGAFIAYKMQNPKNSPKWRRLSWTLFSIVFFSQMIIGLLGAGNFLMTGKLHLPVPLMIISGPLYRGHLSVMTILFLSTVILTGPAWCSQLCYFGVWDNILSDKSAATKPIKNKAAIKTTGLLIVIIMTLLLRFLQVPLKIATLLAIAFGLGGIAVIIFISRKKGYMAHCLLYCPIGTIVNYLKLLNPFRIYIDKDCTMCMKCTTVCKYDALNLIDLKNRKPGPTCTYCGDCISACKDNYIRYRFFNLQPETARKLYLFLTVSIHAVFLALARI